MRGPAKFIVTAVAGIFLQYALMTSPGFKRWASFSAKGRSLKFSFFYAPSKELYLFFPGKCSVKVDFQGFVKVFDLEKKLYWSGTFQEASERLLLVLEVEALDRLWIKKEDIVEVPHFVLRVSRRFSSGEPKVISIVGGQGRYLLRILKVEKDFSTPKMLYNSFKMAPLEEVCTKFTRRQK